MKRVALAVAVFLGAAAFAADEKPQKLDGTYAVKSGEKDGEAIPAEELKKIVEVVIRDDLFTMKKGGSRGPQGQAQAGRDEEAGRGGRDAAGRAGEGQDASWASTSWRRTS